MRPDPSGRPGGAMRWSSILSEATRNVASGTIRAMLASLALLVIIAGTVLQDALAVEHVFIAQRAVRTGGGATHIIAAPAGIDGQRCVALQGLKGVVGAIALREVRDRFDLLAYPHSKPALYDVAGDIPATLDAQPSGPPGVWLSEAMATRFGTGPLAMADGTSALVAGTFPYPDDGRNSQLASAALQPVPSPGRFDARWATIWPHDEATFALLSTVVVPGTDNVARQQLNPAFGTPTPTISLLQTRSTRWLLVIGAAASACLGYTLIRTRRVELSLAQHLGVRATQQHIQLELETMCWALPASALATTITLVVTTANTTAPEARWLVTHILVGVAACLVATLTGSMAAALTITGKKLYSWTKDR